MNVLLVGYETESCSLALLGKRLQADGHEVLLVNADYHNFLNNESIQNFYHEHDFDDWTNFEEEYGALYRTNWTVDWAYLDEFESRYCVTKNFHQLLLSDPLLSRHHHHRQPYYTPIESRDLIYHWAQELIRWIEGIIDSFDPDLIFTYKRNYFVKNAVAQIAMTTGILMLTLIKSRVKQFCHLTRHFGHGPDPDAREYLESTSSHDLEEGRSHVEEYGQAGDSATLYDATSQERLDKEQLFSNGEIVSDWLSNQMELVKRRYILGNKRKYAGRLQGNHFDSYTPAQIRYHTRIAINRLKYRYNNPFRGSTPDGRFVYFPLHTLPESATLTLSTEYFETDLVRYVAKELPVGVTLAVKENPNMVGIRPFDEYREIKESPNVELIDPTVPSKRLIEESSGVCGISGTALLEAAALGTPTHAFGEPEFLDVVDFSEHGQIRSFVAACDSGKSPKNPDTAMRYLQYVFDNGTEIDLYKLRNKQSTPEFRDGVDKVYQMLEERLAAPPPAYSP